MLKVGKLELDTSELSVDEVGVLEFYVEDGVLTDEVVEVLSKASRKNRSVRSEGESKASKMKKMSAAGMSTGDIARVLDVRFQFVYNVLSKERLKKNQK
jgi:hypothetical protein